MLISGKSGSTIVLGRLLSSTDGSVSGAMLDFLHKIDGSGATYERGLIMDGSVSHTPLDRLLITEGSGSGRSVFSLLIFDGSIFFFLSYLFTRLPRSMTATSTDLFFASSDVGMKREELLAKVSSFVFSSSLDMDSLASRVPKGLFIPASISMASSS